MLSPFDSFQVDTLLNHFPEWTERLRVKITKTVTEVDFIKMLFLFTSFPATC